MDNDNCECRASSSGFVFCPVHAAAPTMLEALETMNHAFNDVDIKLFRQLPESIDAALAQLQDAIAQARKVKP